MKQMFRNITALCLLFAYSLSISVSIQNFIADSVLDSNLQQDVSHNTSNSKTPELSVFPDLEPLADIVNENLIGFQFKKVKTPFQRYKSAEKYALTKDNQYLFQSILIQPGLPIDTLLYPFHTFS